MYFKKVSVVTFNLVLNFVLKHPFNLRKIRIYRVTEKGKIFAWKPVKIGSEI